MKKHDFLILFSVLLAALAAFFIIKFCFRGNGSTVVITENGKEVYSVSLYENRTIRLDGNTVVIKNGSVFVSEADCKNQICVNHKPVSKCGESIVCLPNGVVAEVR